MIAGVHVTHACASTFTGACRCSRPGCRVVLYLTGVYCMWGKTRVFLLLLLTQAPLREGDMHTRTSSLRPSRPSCAA